MCRRPLSQPMGRPAALTTTAIYGTADCGTLEPERRVVVECWRRGGRLPELRSGECARLDDHVDELVPNSHAKLVHFVSLGADSKHVMGARRSACLLLFVRPMKQDWIPVSRAYLLEDQHLRK